jgi:arginine deiminase
MSITANTLIQARQVLVTNAQEKLGFMAQLREQSAKIADLEREVQKQATAASQAQQALANAQVEIQALRSMIPDEATLRAFEQLTQCLAAPAQSYSDLRIAA